MSFQNTQLAEAIPELELNKETLHDLEVDGSLVKGGVASVSLVAGAPVQNPGTIRMTATGGGSGTTIIHQNPSGG